MDRLAIRSRTDNEGAGDESSLFPAFPVSFMVLFLFGSAGGPEGDRLVSEIPSTNGVMVADL